MQTADTAGGPSKTALNREDKSAMLFAKDESAREAYKNQEKEQQEFEFLFEMQQQTNKLKKMTKFLEKIVGRPSCAR